MIHVNRDRVPRPWVFDLQKPSPAAQELAEAIKFYRDGHRQRRFMFKAYQRPEVKQALTELFHGKCAYCEARVTTTAPVDIEMYRPKGGVLERPEHPGYWWLAMVWENLLASCADCNRVRDHDGIKSGKANRFPLEDEVARAFDPADDLSREAPLLLDPCTDFPEDHLVFGAEGTVVSDTKRGQTTITVLGLNRPALVAARQAVAHTILVHIKRIDMLIKKAPKGTDQIADEITHLRELTEDREEFAALKRQLIKPAMDRWIGKAQTATASFTAPTPKISASRKRTARRSFEQYQVAQSTYSLKDDAGRAKYREQRRFIERIAIRDIKAIREVDLDLTSSTGRTPWLMLLGENGTGKSTVLQATALVLLGAEAFIKLAMNRGVNPTPFVRYGQPSGSISVQLSGFPKPHVLVFRENAVDFTSPTGEQSSILFSGSSHEVQGAGWLPQILLLGYGATRLLPRQVPGQVAPPDTALQDGEFSRVDNLFDPFAPLIDAERWLLKLDQKSFDDIAPILRDLMPLPPDAELVPDGDRVVVVVHGARVPLRQLSDGYQSVVVMTVDILQVALRIWPNLRDAEGAVLLDEIGAHLHPTWKMRAVTSLRKTLPGMQFLVTTHDPLCLRGLGKGEVAVMRRGDDSQVFSLTGLPSPGDFRVDQLLTSDFFGLSSTVDPDVEALFDEYYALLVLRDRNAEQTARLDTLQNELKSRRHFGSTLRENLMYEAVDRLVAQHRVHPKLRIEDLKEEAVAEVSKIWNES
ncbi:MAG TPA: AAA family ATPase [Thermoanaerobaculia bacterium]|jgi:uncharacterized protein (TIGR02646 family)|nr:AAA family ATPase [Thermoanaerobaculia bacterium]